MNLDLDHALVSFSGGLSFIVTYSLGGVGGREGREKNEE
jgi:hypothetical protein